MQRKEPCNKTCNKTAVYVDSGRVGTSNTINRAELTGIASALRAKCTYIAMDSACSLSQKRKQLLFPKLYRKHTHVKVSGTNHLYD